MLFLLAQIRKAAMSHLLSGMCERSNSVPVITVNCLRQADSLHWYRPGRVSSAVPLFTVPQWLHTGRWQLEVFTHEEWVLKVGFLVIKLDFFVY